MPAAPQAQRAEKSLGGRIRRLVFSDANFLDDAQARPRAPPVALCGGRCASQQGLTLSAAQLEEDNREVLRLLRDSGVPEKLEGLKRLIAQSARPGPAYRLSHCVRARAALALPLCARPGR